MNAGGFFEDNYNSLIIASNLILLFVEGIGHRFVFASNSFVNTHSFTLSNPNIFAISISISREEAETPLQ